MCFAVCRKCGRFRPSIWFAVLPVAAFDIILSSQWTWTDVSTVICRCFRYVFRPSAAKRGGFMESCTCRLSSSSSSSWRTPSQGDPQPRGGGGGQPRAWSRDGYYIVTWRYQVIGGLGLYAESVYTCLEDVNRECCPGKNCCFVWNFLKPKGSNRSFVFHSSIAWKIWTFARHFYEHWFRQREQPSSWHCRWNLPAKEQCVIQRPGAWTGTAHCGKQFSTEKPKCFLNISEYFSFDFQWILLDAKKLQNLHSCESVCVSGWVAQQWKLQ